MQWRRQLEFIFQPLVVATSLREVSSGPQGRGYTRDAALEQQVRELLRPLGADKLAREIRVEWNPRMKSAAGRADFHEKLISLNPWLKNRLITQSPLNPNRIRNECSGRVVNRLAA